MELFLLPFFIIPLIFSIRRIIKGNLSREEWVLYYISISAALVGIFYGIKPKVEDFSLWVFVIFTIIFLGSPILVRVISKYLSSKSVVQLFKNSSIIKGKIQEFSYRQQLNLEEYLDTAKQEIIFVSITHEIFTRDYTHLLGKYLFQNIKIKILLLNPSSEYVKDKSNSFFVKEEKLRQSINDTLKKLCDFKNSLTKNKENLSIYTHNCNIPESMIIIDGNDDYRNKKSSIKIEKYEHSPDYDPRRSYIVFLQDNEFNYTEIYKNYQFILSTKTPYC